MAEDMLNFSILNHHKNTGPKPTNNAYNYSKFNICMEYFHININMAQYTAFNGTNLVKLHLLTRKTRLFS